MVSFLWLTFALAVRLCATKGTRGWAGLPAEAEWFPGQPVVRKPAPEHAAGPPYAVVYRIVGNDMPPLQEFGQGYKNVEFILTHENPPPAGIERRWLLNRIANATHADALRALLARHGCSGACVAEVPFERAALQTLRAGAGAGKQWINAGLLYLTNQNGARNTALMLAHASGFQWALPLDGNLFFVDDAWANVDRALRRAPGHAAQIGMLRLRVPQQRALGAYGGASHINSMLDAHHLSRMSEPQLCLRVGGDLDAAHGEGWWKAAFNERLGYGANNKVEALQRWCHADAPGEACECAELGAASEEHRSTDRAAVLAAAGKCGGAVRMWFWPTAEAVKSVKGFIKMAGNARSDPRFSSVQCGKACKADGLTPRSGDDDIAHCIEEHFQCRVELRQRAMKVWGGWLKEELAGSG